MLKSIILHTILAIVYISLGTAPGLSNNPAEGLSINTVVGLHRGADVSQSIPTITLEVYREAEETIGNPESEAYDEEAFCRIIRQALEGGILGEADKMRAQCRLEIAAKNHPGTIATDFRFVDRDDDERTLHSIKTDKPILLIFYDPDCDHCMQAIARIRDTELSKRTQIVAIYAEEDRERWEETAPSLPEGWIVGFATDPIQDDETYVFLSSPTIYLLDSDKKVILKDTTLDAIEKTIHNA